MTDHVKVDGSETTERPRRSPLSKVLLVSRYAIAFLGLPLLVGAIGVGEVTGRLHSHADPFEAEIGPPLHDPEKPTAVVLLSNVWTEATDFLGPYQILAESDAYNVYAVAPQRTLTPLNGAIDVMPHYSIAEFESAGLSADVLVVPFMTEIHGEENRPLLDWIARHDEEGGTILSICAGAEVVAASGALEGRRATTIWMGIDNLERLYPATTWVRNVRYEDDGNIISSAGVTSGIDATLYLLKRDLGEARAMEVARDIGYPHTQFLSDPVQPTSHNMLDLTPMALHGAYQWDRPSLGVALESGVTELELASVVDIYTPAVAKVTTVGQEREPVETANGLHVVPRSSIEDAPRLDRVLVLGDGNSEFALAWAGQAGIPVTSPHLAGERAGQYAFDGVTLQLAAQENVAIARATADSIEYPLDHLQMSSTGTLAPLVVRPLLLGLLGTSTLFALERLLRARRGNTTQNVSSNTSTH